MRSNIWMWLLLVVSMTMSAFAQSGANPEKKSPLVGNWQVQVTQVDCSNGTPLGPAFTSNLTFAADGTMAEDTSNPIFGKGQRGGGQGWWNSTGQSSYAATSFALIKYTTPPNQKKHNPGFNAGQQTISQTITFDGGAGTWSSTAAVSFADQTGNVYRTGCAVATASSL